MLYKEWIDFVVYPSDANKGKTRLERLFTKNALSQDEKFEDPEDLKRYGYIVSWKDYDFKGDVFEAIWIGDDGDVIVWTEKKVWSLHRRIDGKEKMTYVPRNPDLAQLF